MKILFILYENHHPGQTRRHSIELLWNCPHCTECRSVVEMENSLSEIDWTRLLRIRCVSEAFMQGLAHNMSISWMDGQGRALEGGTESVGKSTWQRLMGCHYRTPPARVYKSPGFYFVGQYLSTVATCPSIYVCFLNMYLQYIFDGYSIYL